MLRRSKELRITLIDEAVTNSSCKQPRNDKSSCLSKLEFKTAGRGRFQLYKRVHTRVFANGRSPLKNFSQEERVPSEEVVGVNQPFPSLARAVARSNTTAQPHCFFSNRGSRGALLTVSKPGAKRGDWISPMIRSVGNHSLLFLWC